MKMGQKDGKREGEATSTRRLSPFHLLLFRILPTLPQLTALSPNALAISQILRQETRTDTVEVFFNASAPDVQFSPGHAEQPPPSRVRISPFSDVVTGAFSTTRPAFRAAR
jgi:hypothetical protein